MARHKIAAIGITIDGGWTADGKPATNQTPLAVIANLGCSIPLIALCTLIVFDVRRSRQRIKSETTVPDSPPAGGYDNVGTTERP